MKPLSIGRHRQRVTLLDVPETSQDSYGQPSLATTTIGTYWAELRPLRGNEQLNVRQLWPTATHLVRMRWIGSDIPVTARNPYRQILPRMQFQAAIDGSVLNVLFASNVEKRNRQWEIICEEKVNT